MKSLDHIKSATPYQDINEVLLFLAQGMREIFKDELIGFYLTGSLSYGDFEMGRSDIDLAVVLTKPVSAEKLASVKKLHEDVEQKYEAWHERIECSYIPLSMIKDILPPRTPRPYFGDGIFYAEADYGNEWIINQYMLYNYGVTLIGPEFKTLVEPIDIADVKAACIRDLYKEWAPRIADPSPLADSHLQSYIVLNLCRILYAVMRTDAVSKKVASAWAKEEYPEWENLIETAENWHYGIKMEQVEKTVEFIKFAIGKIGEKK